METIIVIAVIIGVVIGIAVSSVGKRKSKRNGGYNYHNYKDAYKTSKPDFDIASYTEALKKEETQPADDLRWKNIKVVTRDWAFDSKAEQEMYNFLRHELGGSVRIDFHVHLNEICELPTS